MSITWKLFTKYLSSSGSKESYFAACTLDLFPLFRSRQLLNPRLGCFQFDQPRNSYMYWGGLHMDVYLVGLHRDVQIEQYLDLEMQLERKLGNHNSCILSNDRHAASRGTNLPASPFDCCVNIKYFGGLLLLRLGLKSEIQFFLIDVFLQIMACKLTNLSGFTPDKNLSCSEAGRRRV